MLASFVQIFQRLFYVESFYKGGGMLIQDECADNLFDVLIEFFDFGEIEQFATLHISEKQSELEFLDL